MGNCFSKKNPNGDRSPSSPEPVPRHVSERYEKATRIFQKPHKYRHDIPVMAPCPPMYRILGKPYEDVRRYYTLGEELGRGQTGVTYYICTEISSGHTYACKSISKRLVARYNDDTDIIREIDIMQLLSGRSNIVEVKGTYEDEQFVHLVLEHCAGGELFDRIIAQGHYTEKDVASICRQIVNVVRVCHSKGIMLGDLKPENFLFSSRDENSMLKATDFRSSVFTHPGNEHRDMVGSAYYVAPEVLKCNYQQPANPATSKGEQTAGLGTHVRERAKASTAYGKEIDIWSAGVILYILLSGVPPFWAETKKGIFDAILEGEIDLDTQQWPSISRSAKDLVRKMLTRDPEKRLTPAQVLEHPWLREDGEALDKPIDSAVLSKIKQFRAMDKLKKLALKVIAESMSEDEIVGLKAILINMDTDKSGSVTYEELKTGLARLGSKLAEAEVKKLMEADDVDGTGTIDYIEFITATMHMHRFCHFDADNRGCITMDEPETAMKDSGMGDEDTISGIDK